MTAIDKRVVPLRALAGAEVIEVQMEKDHAHVVLRCRDKRVKRMSFSRVETVTRRGAEGMVVARLTEEIRLGGQLPSRFVFEDEGGTRTLGITAAGTGVAGAADEIAWRSVARSLFSDARLARPAPRPEIGRVRRALGVALPSELAGFLAVSNGLRAQSGARLIWSATEIVEQNRELRGSHDYAQLYMPFDCLLFFGTPGNGDHYGYRILGKAIPATTGIYRWDHENDSREWFANDLEDYLKRCAQ